MPPNSFRPSGFSRKNIYFRESAIAPVRLVFTASTEKERRGVARSTSEARVRTFVCTGGKKENCQTAVAMGGGEEEEGQGPTYASSAKCRKKPFRPPNSVFHCPVERAWNSDAFCAALFQPAFFYSNKFLLLDCAGTKKNRP